MAAQNVERRSSAGFRCLCLLRRGPFVRNIPADRAGGLPEVFGKIRDQKRDARRRIQRRQAVRQHLRHHFRRVGQYADADQRHGRRRDGRLCARRDSRRGQKRSGRDEEFSDGSDPAFIEHRRRDRSPLAPCAASLDAAHFLCTFHPVSGSGFSPQASRKGYTLVTFLPVRLFSIS